MEEFVQSVISIFQNKNIYVEGFTVPKQADQIITFLKSNPNIKTVAETGFNIGMSSAAMLSARPDIKVWAFDLAEYMYVLPQKRLIDKLFPSRHTLIIGDTMKTLPNFNEIIKEPIFDFVFIDGGHVAPVPENDIRNLLKLLKPGCFICIDDYNLEYGYEGVIQAVNLLILEKLIEKVDVFEDGDRSWVYCKKL